MASDVSVRRSHRSAPVRALALAAVLTAALLALMSSGVPPEPGPMERSAFRGGQGYWLLAKDGGVFAFGDAKFFGPNRNQGRDIAGMAATTTGNGYWTVDDDGDVFAYGDAVDYGSRPGPEIDNVVGFSARSQGDGYWMVSEDGAVYAFGQAAYFGSANTLKLKRPIVGMAATPSGRGYWLIAGDGGVFAYGDAPFFGSTGSIRLNRSIIDFGPAPDGKGYRFIGSDGGAFTYGSAGFFGSTGSMTLNQPIVGFATTATGKGYWLVGKDGGVFSFGDAQFYGSTGSLQLNAEIVAIVPTPRITVLPTARDDVASVAEDGSTTIDVESNDTHTLPAAVSVDTPPANGTATVTGGKVVYKPRPDFNGKDTFKYKLTDTVGHSATATVSVTVTAVPDAPVAKNSSATTNEDIALNGTLTATDADGDTLSYTKVSGPSSGTATVNANGTFTYTPSANFNGTDSFAFQASDGTGRTSTAIVSLTVKPVNDLPTISPVADQTIAEDAATTALAFTVNDVETGSAALTVTGSSSNTALVPNGNIAIVAGSGGARTVTVTPVADGNGQATIGLTVTDGNAGSTTETFLLTVTPVPDVPVANAATLLTDEDTDLDGQLSATDPDGAALTYAVVAGPTNGTLSLDTANGEFTYSPASDYNGPDSFSFAVNDGTTDSNTATVSITVNSVNDVPTISTIADQTTDEDTAAGPVTFTIGDVETAAGSLVLSGSSDNTTLVPNANITFGGSGSSPTVTVTPAANESGTATITVTVDDGTDTTSEAFVLTVNAVNDPPTISNIIDLSTDEDTATGTIGFTVGDVETAAAGLTVTATSDDEDLVADGDIELGGSGENRTVRITPAANQSGVVTITVTVSDGSDSETDTFVLTIEPVNDPPSISDIDPQTIIENEALTDLSFTVGDPEGDSVSVTGHSSDQTLVADASIVVTGVGSTRLVTVTPNAGQEGTVTITLTADDGNGGTTTESFVLTIEPDEEPLAANISVGVLDVAAGIDVLTPWEGLGNGPVVVTVEAATLDTLLEGTATVVDGTIHLTLAVGGLLPFEFDYTITDVDGDSSTGTVTVSLL